MGRPRVPETGRSVREVLMVGAEKHRSGNFSAAKTAYESVLSNHPDHPDALYLLGVLFYQLDDCARAEALIAKALSFAPRNSEYHSNYALVLRGLGQDAKAESHFVLALNLDPKNSAALTNLGRLYQDQGQFDRALSKYSVAIESAPTATAFSNRGIAQQALGHFDEAEADFKRAIALNPAYPDAYSNLGALYAGRFEAEKALQCFNKAIDLDPSYLQARANRGAAFIHLWRYEEALADFDWVLTQHPNHIDTRCNRGGAFNDLRRYDDAQRDFDMALQLDSHNAQALFGLAVARLATYQFESGWHLFDTRVGRPELKIRLPQTRRPRWTGGNDPGRLLICGEQGLGDDIFFSSALPLVSHLSSTVTIQVDQRLVPLFQRSFPALKFVSASETISDGLFDQYMLLGSIYQALHGRVADPERMTRKAYLAVDEDRVRRIKAELVPRGERLCGLTWRSERAEFGARKSIPLTALQALLQTSNVRFVSLQYGDVTQELADFQSQTGIEILQCASVDNFNDIDGHAALVKACDFAILISNTTAHIAGGLGCPAHVYIPAGRGRFYYWNNRVGSKSFWYPTLSLHDSIESLTAGAAELFV